MIIFDEFTLHQVKMKCSETTFEAKWTELIADKDFGILPVEVAKKDWNCLNTKVFPIFAYLAPFAKELGDHENAEGVVVKQIKIVREEGEILKIGMKYEHTGVSEKPAKCDTGLCSVLRLDEERQKELRTLIADLETNMYEFFIKGLRFKKKVLEIQIG